jgi:hypothetical protein
MATHGIRSRLLVDGLSLTAMSRMARCSLSKENADCSVIDLLDKEYTPGQRGAVFSTEGIHKGNTTLMQQSVDDMVGPSDSTHEVAYAPAGFGVGETVLFGTSHRNNCEVGGDNKSVVFTNFTFQVTGGATKGVSLFDPFA